jgi:hypothetical protein
MLAAERRENYCAGKYGCFTPEELNKNNNKSKNSVALNVYVWSTPWWKPS